MVERRRGADPSTSRKDVGSTGRVKYYSGITPRSAKYMAREVTGERGRNSGNAVCFKIL